MGTSLKNVKSRISMCKNEGTITTWVMKKRPSGRNKKMTNIKKGEIIMSLKRYITMSSYLAMVHSRAKIKQSTRKFRKCLLLTQDLYHIWLIAWKICQTYVKWKQQSRKEIRQQRQARFEATRMDARKDMVTSTCLCVLTQHTYLI